MKHGMPVDVREGRGFCRCWSSVLVLAALVRFGIPLAEAQGKAAPDDWYRDSWIHSHISLSLPPAELDSYADQIRAAGLDAVQFHTHRLDLWDAVRKARLDQKLAFKMVATINAAGSWYPQYDKDPAYVQRVHPDGSFAGRWSRKHLCFNAPVVRERIIPARYQRLPARIQPDQVWIDECIVTVNLCWCEHCTRLYHKQHGAEPPTGLTKTNRDKWTRWTTFHRKSFERWMVDVDQAIQGAAPGTLLTFNHAWFVEQPETPPPHIRNLCADIHNDPLELGLYARYGGSFDLPFDLMPGLGADIWAGVRPKSIDQIKRDVALITAHGGRWNIGEYPTNAGTLRKEAKDRPAERRPVEAYVELARAGAAFARERQAFSQHTRPVPYVALLHAASTHYDHVISNVTGAAGGGYGKTSDGTFRLNEKGKINSRVYWPGNKPVADSIVGAYQALLENHIHFNFITEDRLQENLDRIALLVLPEQHRLAPESARAIRNYVREGGRLLATGTTRQSGLDDLFDFESDSPRDVGRGRSLYLRADLFRQYHTCSGYSRSPKGDAAAIRQRITRAFKTLLPSHPYELDASPWFEWTLRRSADGRDLLVHLINRKSDWHRAGDPDARPLRCSLALDAVPSTVTLEPGGEALKWGISGGRLTIDLDPKTVLPHRIIRIAH